MKMRAALLAPVLALAALPASEAVSAQSEVQSRHFTTSDGARLHYLEAGKGPALVFVPGWTMPAWIWEPQIEYFASDYRVVALDPRGQGQSEKPSYGYHAIRRAQDICELLDHLGGEPAVVTGWSIAVQEVLLCTHEVGTEAVRAVVLVDHPIDLDADREFAKNRIENLQRNREEWTRNFVEVIHRHPQPEEYLGDLTEAALATPTNAAALMIANVYFTGPRNLRPALDALGRPVLFVFSSLDWAITGAEEIREGWPEIPVEVIDETSHALFRDKPEDFNRVLEEFLATLPAQ